MLKALLFRLLLVLFGLTLGLFIVEVALRIVPPRREITSEKIETPRTTRPGQPDFRQRDFYLRKPKAPGTFRLLVVGDSFTWGHGIPQEDAYPDQMASRLAMRRGAQPVEVVNFSSPGWNSGRELRSLTRWIEELAPDALVVGYCLNDAEPGDQNELKRLRRGSEVRRPASALSRFLYQRSRAYRISFDKLEVLRRRRALTAYFLSLYEQPGWEEAKEALAGFKRQSERLGIPMLLVVFPIFDSQLDWRYTYTDLHERVRSYAESRAIATLDLLPAYRGMDGRRLALVPYTDGHPSKLAHQIAAEAILGRLEEMAVLPHTPIAEAGASNPSATQ